MTQHLFYFGEINRSYESTNVRRILRELVVRMSQLPTASWFVVGTAASSHDIGVTIAAWHSPEGGCPWILAALTSSLDIYIFFDAIYRLCGRLGSTLRVALLVLVIQGVGGGKGPTAEYVVVGHCCESGDLLTPVSGSAEEIDRRVLDKAEIGGCISH